MKGSRHRPMARQHKSSAVGWVAKVIARAGDGMKVPSMTRATKQSKGFQLRDIFALASCDRHVFEEIEYCSGKRQAGAYHGKNETSSTNLH